MRSADTFSKTARVLVRTADPALFRYGKDALRLHLRNPRVERELQFLTARYAPAMRSELVAAVERVPLAGPLLARVGGKMDV